MAYVRRGDSDVFEAHGDLSPTSVIEVASLSKAVFAFALITEACRGAIDLDAPLPTFARPPYPHVHRGVTDSFDDPRLARVTPRLLLSHRAGLPNWSRARPLAFEEEPGTRWRYSGEGYLLLQRVIESARSESLEAFVQRAALTPLGMARSTFDPRGTARRAQGHDRAGTPVQSSLDGANAATSLLSAASDLARFARRIVEAPPRDPIVGAMLARQVDVDPKLGLSWGLGLALAEPGWFFHWGANPGVRALLVGSRARGEAVVVVTNSEGGMELAADIVRAHFGDLPLLRFEMLYPED